MRDEEIKNISEFEKMFTKMHKQLSGKLFNRTCTSIQMLKIKKMYVVGEGIKSSLNPLQDLILLNRLEQF